MTVVREQAHVHAPEPLATELLIEEARQRQLRRRRLTVIATLLVIAGGLSYAVVGGRSGGASVPPASHAIADPQLATALASTGVTRAQIIACASITTQGGPEAGKNVPSNLAFVLLKRGVVGTMRWSFWFGEPAGGAPFESIVAVSGAGDLCVEPDYWGGGPDGWDGIAQLPGKPIAFIFGDVALTRPRGTPAIKPPYRPLSRITAVLNGRHASATATRVGSSPFAYLFTEVTGLRCASASDGSAGLYESEVDYAGNSVIGSGFDGPTGHNSTSTGVYCGVTVPPSASLQDDLAAAPQALRSAVLRTIGASDVSIVTAAEHPLSAHSWTKQDSTYQAPNRYQGPYQPAHCGKVGGSSGPVVSVILDSTSYQVEENCFDGHVVLSDAKGIPRYFCTTPGRRSIGSTCQPGPKVEQDPVSGEEGLTAAEVAAFGSLLTTIHTATHFAPVAGGFAYSSDLHLVDAYYVQGRAPIVGTITVAKGYVTSITSSSYYLDCEPLGPSCHFTSSTTFTTSRGAPVIEAPLVKDYLSGQH
jgi:hypothetical protein